MTVKRDDDFAATGSDDSGSEIDAEEVEVAEIRAEIEETRIEMGGTLNELGDRLDPGHLMDQAKENVREATIGRVEETAKGMSDMVMETIKRNPIPAAMAGAGLALLWMNKSNGNGQGYQSGSRYAGDTSMGWDDRRGHGQSDGGVAGMASSVGQQAGDKAGQVGETIGEVGEHVGQAVGQGVQEVGWRFERFMNSSPLAMGAVALGAGAVVGAVIPETPKEREVFGEASRAVGETVRDTVGQATDRVEAEIDHAEGPGA